MKGVAIYVLRETGHTMVRYVGSTKSPATRLSAHLSEGGHTAKHVWIDGLRRRGAVPEMVVVEVCSHRARAARERVWVRRHASTVLNERMNPARVPVRSVPETKVVAASLDGEDQDRLIKYIGREAERGVRLRPGQALGALFRRGLRALREEAQS